ncbi:hypothetical protein D9758_011337 [Tetrapyrgos nigripes]|uniref:F-box domain-containing protein n=1 Tax=Tetrapyrgos nigripes TaxID=182062 RepID=A0A8H5G856_9AGAR|nr:hypothetical protein D9758_011337 [Tetrapyrgos nigripes]
MSEHSSLSYDDILQRHRAGTFISSSHLPQLLVTHEKSAKEYQEMLTEIEHREKELEVLRAQAAHLRKFMNLITALSAPIRKLPSEALSLIMQRSIGSLRPFMLHHLPETPNFLKVCSYWRDVALSSPEIWSEVRLHIESTYAGRPIIFGPLQLHLQRSKACSLSVDVMIDSSEFPPKDAEAASQMFDIVVSHAARWKRLIVGHLGLTPSSTSTASFPLLESFECKSYDIPDSTFSTILTQSPGLRTLATPIFPVDLHMAPAFNTITTLRLLIGPQDPKHLTIFELLEKCPNVVSLSYDLSFLRGNTPWRSLIIPQISNSVDHLYITFSYPGVTARELLPRLLASFTFPNLKSLHIACSSLTWDFPWPQKEFSAFLKRSGCDITRLDLQKLSASKDHVISILESLPSVVDLTIHETYEKLLRLPPIITPTLLQRLNATAYHLSRPDNPNNVSKSTSELLSSVSAPPILPLCPKLTRISFIYPSNNQIIDPFDEDAFADMITSRTCPTAPAYLKGTATWRDMGEVQCLRFVYISEKLWGEPSRISSEIRERLEKTLRSVGGRFWTT